MSLAPMKYVAVAAICAAAAGAAQAADLAPAPARQMLYSKAPIAESFSWTGFYVGGNVGWNWTDVTQTDTGPGVFGQVFPIGSVTTFSHNGFLGGAQLGYNYQMGRFVLGLEGEFDWSASKLDQGGTLGALTFNTNVKNNYVATLAPRFGYAFDRALVYGKVGVAWSQEEYNMTASDGSAVTGRFDRWGWLIGAGVEYAIWDRLTLKAEYEYIDFGTKNETLTPNAIDLVTGTITGDPSDSKVHTQVFKVGVNYLFH